MDNIKLVLLLGLIFFTGNCLGQNVNCTEGDIRLHNKSVPDEGMLQRCNAFNQWEAICNYGWDCVDAIVACQQLGFNDSRPELFGDGYFGRWDSMFTYYYECSSESYTSLQQCSRNEDGNCYISNHPNRMAGVACHSPLGDCSHGDLRLVDGMSESEGLVEVCYKGGWYSVCGIDDNEASVMCRQLGHTEYSGSVVFAGGRFGQSPHLQGYIHLDCSVSSLYDKWADCNVLNPSCGTCIGDAIKCFTPECEEGSLRLVDGIIDNEGRVEVCLQGVWGTICSESGWNRIDGYVTCKQLNLGTSGIGPTIYTSSKFGDGDQPQVMYSPNCDGWENALTDCVYVSDFVCNSRASTAGVLCFDDCKDGEVRVVGGKSDAEGTVEICIDNLWGLIGESGWTTTDAVVICRQLGFPTDDVQAVNKSFYGKPRKLVHWSNVNCNGDEQQIVSCGKYEFPSFDDKKTILGHINVAGVKCQSSTLVTPADMNTTNGSGSAGLNGEAPAVLVVPTYLTMLMVIASLALSIIHVGILFMRRNQKNAVEVKKQDSIPMSNRDSYPSRYTVQPPRNTVPANSKASMAASHRPTASVPHHVTKSGTLPPTVTATEVPPPLPQARTLTRDESEPMYECTDLGAESYIDMS